MIALVAAAAFGGSSPTTVDVLLLPVTVRTQSVVAETEALDIFGQPVVNPVAPDRAGLGHRGLSIELGTPAPFMPPHQVLVMVGFRLENPAYERTGFTFSPTAGEATLDVGMRFWFAPRGDPALDAYGIGFTGVQLGFVSAPPLQNGLMVAPALNGGVGIGVGARRGRIRPRIEGRADVAARYDSLSGRVEEPIEAFTWRWYPGSAAASLLFGVGFGPRTSSEAAAPEVGGPG